MATRHRLVTPPAVEPVTLAEAKTFVRVDHDAADAELTRAIAAARQVCETWTRRRFITQTWEISWAYGTAPERDIALRGRPVQSIASVTSWDALGAPAVMDADEYVLDDGVLRLASPSSSWPIGTRTVRPLVLEYVVGYGDEPSDVPEAIREAILHVTRASFEREADVLPRGGTARTLLAPFRNYAA